MANDNYYVIASTAVGSFTLSNLTRGVAISRSGDAMPDIFGTHGITYSTTINTGLSDRFVSRLGDCHAPLQMYLDERL